MFFTSDTHFNQKRTLNLSKRPFKNIEEMNNDLISKWNNIINKEDMVYHLGDFGDYNFIKNLNGKVILIMGNYEQKDMKDNFNNDFNEFKKHLLNLGFYDVMGTSLKIKINGIDEIFNLCHKPEDCNKNELNLFGHIHGYQMLRLYGLNVGTDAHHFYPLNENDIKFYINVIKKYVDKNIFE